MSDFTDHFVDNAKQFAGKAAVKATELAALVKEKAVDAADAVKLEVAINKEENNLKQEYEMLGQLAYNIQKGVITSNDEILAASIARIDDVKDKIAALEQLKQERKAENEKA